MNQYKKGEIVTGFVTGVEKYGIFVKLDDFHSGLIHISEISDLFVKNPADYVYIGEIIKTKIIEYDEQKPFYIKLSIKNIDYRFLKQKNKRIIETGRAFNTLNRQLPVWISQKKEELQKKYKKIG